MRAGPRELTKREAARLLAARGRVQRTRDKYDDECAGYAYLIRELEDVTSCAAIADVLELSRQRVHQIARSAGVVRPGRPGRPARV